MSAGGRDVKKEYVIGYLAGVKVEIQWFEGKYWYWNDRSVKWCPTPPNLILITQPENTPHSSNS